MSKNQLFRTIPELSIVEELLSYYGLSTLTDTKSFNMEILRELNTIEKITEYCEELSKYYIPCKAKVYLVNIDEKRCITILKQIIKTHGYTLISSTKSVKGEKMKIYRLIKNDKTDIVKKSTGVIVSFD